MSQTAIKMKELEQRTGFNREAIRFYIREGILPKPEKPKRNVAYYSEVHIKRLLAVKYLQQEREMSLVRIKALLTTGEYDSLVDPASLQGLEQLLPVLVDGITPVQDQLLSEFMAEVDIPEAEVEALASAEVISLKQSGKKTYIGFRDAIIVKKWSQARQAGYTNARGYDTALLALYQKTAQQLARYETELFFSNFSGTMSSDQAAVTVAKGIDLANDIIKQLHTKALLRAIDEKLS